MFCNACNISEQHVFLGGASISSLESNDIKTILEECSQIKPIHVKKGNEKASFCHLHFGNKKDASTFYHFFSTLELSLCSRLGKYYVRKAYDFNNKDVAYDFNLIEEVYNDSCICKNTDITPTSSKSDGNTDINTSLPKKTSSNDTSISPSVVSFYKERKEHLLVEVEQREKVLARKRQEVEDEELAVFKRRKELDLLDEIINL